MRTKVLSGEEVEEEIIIESEGNQDKGEDSGDDEPEFDFAAARAKRSKDLNTIMYNNSDDEEGKRAPLNPKEKKKSQKKQVNLFDMIKETNNVEEEVNDIDFDSENLRIRLTELSDLSDSDNEINTSKNKPKKRIRNTLIDSSDSENDDTNNKSNAVAISENTVENNDIDDGLVVNKMVSFNSSEIVEDTINNQNKNKKRERSLDTDSSNSDGETTVRAKKVKNVRRLVSEDEDED